MEARWKVFADGEFFATLHSRCTVSHSLGLGTSLIRKPSPPLVRYLSALTVELRNVPRFFLTVGSLTATAAGRSGCAEEQRDGIQRRLRAGTHTQSLLRSLFWNSGSVANMGRSSPTGFVTSISQIQTSQMKTAHNKHVRCVFQWI